jgi:hypothetical protein
MLPLFRPATVLLVDVIAVPLIFPLNSSLNPRASPCEIKEWSANIVGYMQIKQGAM